VRPKTSIRFCIASRTRLNEKLVEKLGEPTLAEEPRTGERCELVILAMGKLGGREVSYHSDLDLVFLYEGDGATFHARRSRRSNTTTNNQHFFSELGQRIIKTISRLGPYGKLFEIDPRLRPTGKSGALATTFGEFSRYFASGQGQLWERQALCKARVVYGSPAATQQAADAAANAAYQHPWQPTDALTIRDMRRRMEENALPMNLKRGPGGIVDIEFLVQMLQLEHGAENPALRNPNTLTALAVLHEAGHLNDADYQFLSSSFRFIRTLQSRLQLMNTTARNNLPPDPVAMANLAHGLGYADGDSLLADCRRYTQRNRERFDSMFAALV
jgi:glutamate-ammonia-ligase adenylyltransferase